MSDEAKVTRRWMYIWIAIGTVIVLVVVGFLIAISNALRSIDANLDAATPPIRGVRGDVQPLPVYIARVNAALRKIDRNLNPLHAQAARTIGHLGSIDMLLRNGEGALGDTERGLTGTSGTLGQTSGTLRDTSGTLGNTAGTLSSTGGVLKDVAGTLATTSSTLSTTLTVTGTIDRVLKSAQAPSSRGTGEIWRQVGALNSGPLSGVHKTATGIGTGLANVDAHLQSICEALPLRTLSQLANQQPPQPTGSARC